MKAADDAAWSEDDKITSDLPKTEFLGYETLTAKGRALRLISGKEAVSEVHAGDRAGVALDMTPFYAESGGQSSDLGVMETAGARARVLHVHKVHDVFVHQVEVESGALKFGDVVTSTVESVLRNRTARNHTATHLLHKALRLVLGDHVRQAGSSVDPEQLRFDFTHYEGLNAEQLAAVEQTVNRVIDEFRPVKTALMSQSEAKEQGAIALFDEKYGDTVRVVEVNGFSTELCGGTHVENSGQIGAFRIVSETSVSSGTRRIEAVTGSNLLAPLIKSESAVRDIAAALKTRPENALERAEGLVAELKELKSEAAGLKKATLSDRVSSLVAGAERFNKGLLIIKAFDEADVQELRGVCDDIRAKEKDFIAALASGRDDKAVFIVAVSDSLQQAGFRAGDIVKAMATAAGGGGGGKADMAQAGAKDASKIPSALSAAKEYVIMVATKNR
jgi:alanyl-tRNA synthetase